MSPCGLACGRAWACPLFARCSSNTLPSARGGLIQEVFNSTEHEVFVLPVVLLSCASMMFSSGMSSIEFLTGMRILRQIMLTVSVLEKKWMLSFPFLLFEGSLLEMCGAKNDWVSGIFVPQGVGLNCRPN